MSENDCKEEFLEDLVIGADKCEILPSSSSVEEELYPVLHERTLRKKKKTPEEDLQQIPAFRKGRLDLSLREKIKILEVLDANPRMSQRRISGTFNVSQSQVSRIKNNKSIIMKEWQNGNCERKRKRIGKGGNTLEEKLLKWYKEAKNDCIPLSGPLLIEKAKEIALEQQIKFNPTSGWLGRWKARHGITLKGNKLNKDISMSYSKLCHHWRRYTFTKLIKNYTPDTVWFVGHTNLYYNAIVNNVNELNESKLDKKLKNMSLIFAFDSNGIQRRMPLAVSMEKINNVKLPVYYYDNIDCQITKKIFSRWLLKWDNELKSLKISLIVFLQKTNFVPDNLQLNCITLHFYPEGLLNEPLQIQPFNKGVDILFKSLYRYQIVVENRTKELLKKQVTISSNVNGKFIDSISNSFPVDISLIDALFMIKRSWEHLNPDILVQGVVRAGLSKEVLACSTDGTISSPPLLSDIEFNSLINFESLANRKTFSKVSNDVCNADVNVATPTSVEVLVACQILKKFMQKECANQVDSFAEIETNIQNCLLKGDETCSILHPLYSTKSVHSFHGHKRTLKKRQVTSKVVSEPVLNHCNGILYPPHASNCYDGQTSSFGNHQLQIPSRGLDSSEYGNEFEQHTNSHQSTDCAESSPQTHMNPKNFPIVIPSVVDLNIDPGLAFRTNLQQQPRALQDMNPHIIPISDIHNHTPAFFTFASHS